MQDLGNGLPDGQACALNEHRVASLCRFAIVQFSFSLNLRRLMQCYIETPEPTCRADAGDALGTDGFNAVAQQSDLYGVANKGFRCDARRPFEWTLYHTGASCEVFADIGATPEVEYDVAPRFCLAFDDWSNGTSGPRHSQAPDHRSATASLKNKI